MQTRQARPASGEAVGRKSWVWDETAVGAAREDAPVRMHEGCYSACADLICRTAVYVTRTHGGVGGGRREVSAYPK